MPVPGYRARRADPTGRRRAAETGQIGAAIVEGISGLAQTGQKIAVANRQTNDQIDESNFRIAKEEQARARSAMVADRAGALAEMQVDIAEQIQNLRNDTEAGAYGYEEKAGKLINEKVDAFRTSLGTDPEVVERFEPLIRRYAGETVLREKGWSIDQRSSHEAGQIGKWKSQTANELLTEWSPEKLTSAMEQAAAVTGALDMPGNARKAVLDDINREFTTTSLDHLIESGQTAAAKAILTEGKFDAFLDSEKNDKQNYLRKIGIADDQAAREAAIAQSATRDTVRDEIKSIKMRIEAGEVPDQKTMRALETAAKAAGLDKSDITGLQLLDEDIAVNRAYQGKSATQINRDLNATRARVASGAASPSEQRSVQRLESLVKARNEQESGQYKDLLKNGLPGRVQILAQLPSDPQLRFDQAENVEAGLGHIALLGKRPAGFALEGRELRKSRPDDFGSKKEVHAAALRALGPVSAQLGAEFDDISGVAADIYAATMNSRGRAGFDEKAYAVSLNIALGATRREDGAMQGGVGTVRGKQVLLPESQTATEFDRDLSRHDFASAIYADQTPATKADILGRFRPEYAGDNDRGQPGYVFVDAQGKRLKHKKGSDYIMRVIR